MSGARTRQQREATPPGTGRSRPAHANAGPQPAAGPAAALLDLQRVAGNAAARRLAGSSVQRAVIVSGVPVADIDQWLRDHPAGPEAEAIIREWHADAAETTDHDDDQAVLDRAQREHASRIVTQRGRVQHALTAVPRANPPPQVDYGTVSAWGAWYFAELEYQNNQTNGWHANRLGLLPGAATADGEPTRYVEFRRPGAVGVKDETKMERCIFDLLDNRCWPNAHYGAGYVEITNVPAAITSRLGRLAFVSTGMQAEYLEAKAAAQAGAAPGARPEEVAAAQAAVDVANGTPRAIKQRLLAKMNADFHG